MKTGKETGALNDKFEELTDDMLDIVNGGETDFPLNPSQSGSGDIVLNQQQSGSGNIVLNLSSKQARLDDSGENISWEHLIEG